MLNINETSYSGTYASYFWLPATYGMDSVNKGVFNVIDGIKNKHTIDNIDFSQPLQPRAATPTSKGDFTVGGKTLIPQDMMVYTEFNPRNWEANFLAEKLSRTLLERELPVTAENYMMAMALNRTYEQIETGLYIASLDYAGVIPEDDPRYQLQYFDGILKQMVNDSSILTVSGVVLTKTNVTDQMDLLISKIAVNKKALLTNPARRKRMKFVCSANTEDLYGQNLTGLTFKGNQTNELGVKPWRGYEVISVAGCPDDTIIFCECTADTEGALHVGMNSTEDNNLELMKLQNNSELFFLKGLMKYDVKYKFANEIALSTTLTAASFQP